MEYHETKPGFVPDLLEYPRPLGIRCQPNIEGCGIGIDAWRPRRGIGVGIVIVQVGYIRDDFVPGGIVIGGIVIGGIVIGANVNCGNRVMGPVSDAFNVIVNIPILPRVCMVGVVMDRIVMDQRVMDQRVMDGVPRNEILMKMACLGHTGNIPSVALLIWIDVKILIHAKPSSIWVSVAAVITTQVNAQEPRM